MSYKIITNKIGTRAVLKVYANTNISVNALAMTGETVAAATLTQIFFQSNNAAASGYWRANTSVANNNVLKLLPNDHAFMDFAGVGISPDNDLKTANIVFTIPGTGDTMVIAEFHKLSNANTEY